MTRTLNTSATPWTLVLAATLAAAGLIHCLLTPEHMAMSPMFGAGFLAAGVGQLGMAGLAIVRPSRLLFSAVIASTVVLSSMFAYNVLVGLPFHDDASAAAAEDAADQTDEHADEAAHSADATDSVEAAHSEGDEHPEVTYPSDDPISAAGAGHAEGDDHQESAKTGHSEDGLVLGGGEPVDAYGAVTQFAQLAAAAIAVVLLARSRRLTI